MILGYSVSGLTGTKATPPNRPDRHFGYLTKQYGLGLHGWIVEWCRETEHELATGSAAREPVTAGP